MYSYGTGEALEFDNSLLSHWDYRSEVIESTLLSDVVLSLKALPIHADNCSFFQSENLDCDSDDENFEDPESLPLSQCPLPRTISSIFSSEPFSDLQASGVSETENNGISEPFELPYYSKSTANKRSRYILVEESQLLQLLKSPPEMPCTCNKPLTMTHLPRSGHCERYKWTCSKCKHLKVWYSSSYSQLLKGFRSNAAVPAAFLSTGGTDSDYKAFFDALNAGSLCSAYWNEFQLSSFAPMAHAMVVDQMQAVQKANTEPIIGIDARYDHGRGAEHCTVTGMDYRTRFIISTHSAHRYEAYNTKKQWNNWAGSLEPILAKEEL